MSTSLLRPPERPELRSTDGAGGGGRPNAPLPPRRAPLAVLLVVSALLGGGVSAGVLAATGVLDDGRAADDDGRPGQVGGDVG